MNTRYSFLVRILVICGFSFAMTGPALAFASFQPKLMHFPGPGLQAILVNPPAPATTGEGGGQVQIGVVLDSLPTANVTIPVSSNNLAEGTVDVSELLFTPANCLTEQFITVTGVNDFVDDGDVAYAIDLGPAVSGDLDYDGDSDSVDLTNIDNDPGITVSPTSGLVTDEGQANDTFTIVLNSQPSGGTVTIGLSSNDLTEGQVSPASVSFDDNTWNTPANVTVTGVNDDIADGPQPYTIVTENTVQVGGGGEYNGLDVADVGATNLDNDPAVIVDLGDGVATSEAGPGSDTFTLVLTTEPVADVTIDVGSSDISEGIVSPDSLTFSGGVGGNWATPQTVTVTGVDDFIDDDGATFTVQLTMTLGGDPDYDVIDPNDVTVPNQNNDTASIIVDVGDDGVTTSESSINDSFSIALTSEPTSGVTVNLSLGDSSEGSLPETAHIFSGGAGWDTPWVVAVEGLDDDQIDGDIPYDIQLAITTADPVYSALPPLDPVSVTNQDDDLAGFLFTNAVGLITKEDGTPATFDIALKSQPAAPVTLPLQSSNTSEGTISVDSLTFTPGDWFQPHPVTIAGVDDHLADGSVNYSIITGDPTSEDPNYDVLTAEDVPDVPVVNADDDEAGVTISPNAGLVTTEGRGTALINLVLNTEPIADVEITLSSNDTGEGTFNPEDPEQPATITFSPLNWAAIQSVVLWGVDDSEVDGDVPYAVQVVTQSQDLDYGGMVIEDLAATNQDAPTIQWVKPENNDPYYETSSPEPILLGVEPVSAEPVAYVRFYRWSPELQINVELFVDNAAPYEFYLDPATLDIDFNQIYAYAVDDEVDPTQSVHELLLISRLAALYLPITSK